jgi:uncharacterized membrane protein YGL010W
MIMTSLKDQLRSYGDYHRHPTNKLTHFVGVPLITFSIFLVLSWFRFVPAPDWPLSAATIFFFVVFLYYLRLDWPVALLQAPVNLLLLGLADRAALLPFGQSFLIFCATFVLGWIIQLLGHAIEGKRPALADNFLQIFNAPLFLTAEVLLLLGFRKDLREEPRLGQPEGTS